MEKILENKITFNRDGVRLDGTYRTMLASSLFYFRIPEERWEERMLLLKTAGYHAIDVYFPWNFHEVAPGEWDFTGQRDVTRFLSLAKEHGLFVIARPGPYICSEWDGGALPAWLNEKQVAVRQDDDGFLSLIGAWYEHILPLLSPFQITEGGTLFCMQIENELDFFDCKSPVSYMEKLMAKAKSLGIEVPLFYCCGQNDLLRGGGLTPGLFTSFNVYADAGSAGLEERALHLYRAAADREMPFLITETNREHSFLKRLVACGARLLGPYNQTAGCTLDWYNGITNWGDANCPIALMATDYDFRSMIGSAGEVNAEIYEARLLSGLIFSLGESLATAVPGPAAGVSLQGSSSGDGVLTLLRTSRGGLLEAANPGPAKVMELKCGTESLRLSMRAQDTKLLPWDLSLSADQKTVLKSSNYEVAYIEEQDGSLRVGMYGDGPFTARLLLDGEEFSLDFLPGPEPETHAAGNVSILAGTAETMALSHIPGLPDLPRGVEGQTDLTEAEGLRVAPCALPEGQSFSAPILPMESLGQYRGIGCYRFCLEREGDVLLKGAADILTVRRDGQTLETAYARGNCLERRWKAGSYALTTEIWGHSNFNDIRCRSLHMDSLKGIAGVYTIDGRKDISENWLLDLDEQPLAKWYFFRRSNFGAVSSVDGYNRAAMPLRTVYDKWIDLPDGADGLFLHFSKADCVISAYVNGRYQGDVLPDDPYMDLSRYAGAGRIELCLRILRRFYTDEAGKVTLLWGRRVRECRYAPVTPEKLDFPGPGTQVSFPVRLTPGEDVLLSPDIPSPGQRDVKLFFRGQDVKLTVLHRGHAVGRLMLTGNHYPTVAGGRRDVVYLCREWLEQGPPVIWCQPMGPEPVVEGMEIRYYRSVLEV